MSFLSKLFGSKSDSPKQEVPAKKPKKEAPAVWEQTIEDDDDDDVIPSFEELVAQAEQGDVDAMVSVGMAYIEGEGAPINLKKGLVYIDKAANCGSVEAAGLLYEWARDKINGLGKEIEEVVKYRDLGARAGDIVAQFQLAKCFAEESDQWSTYQQDIPLAHFWFSRASAEGSPFGAMGFAAGLLLGYKHLGPSDIDENGLIVAPTEEQKAQMMDSDPETVQKLREDAWNILNSLLDIPGGAGVITKKLLDGIPKENPDYNEIYKSVIKALDKVN